MNQQRHARTVSQGRKVLPPHARPTKPPTLRRGHSYNSHAQTHHSTSSHHHTHSTGRSTVSRKVDEPEEDEESGMSSFLQFCATCERQIVTPGSTILYCSEACRRKDVSRPPSIPSIHSLSPFNELSTASSYPFELPSGDIMPQRSPTVLRPLSLASSDDFGSNLDLNALDRSESDDPATRYLDRFSLDQLSSKRTHRARTSTTTDHSHSNLPSLVHSPSSSYGTVASYRSHRSNANTNPFSASAHTSRSIDLVLPYDISTGGSHHPTSPTQLLKDASLKSSASTLTSFRTVEAGGMSWQKRKDSRHHGDHGLEEVDTVDFAPRTWTRWEGSEGQKEGDGQLFHHDAIKADPTRRKS